MVPELVDTSTLRMEETGVLNRFSVKKRKLLHIFPQLQIHQLFSNS